MREVPLSILVGATGWRRASRIESIVPGIDHRQRIVAAVQHKKALQVSALYRVHGAPAYGNRRIRRVARNFDRCRHPQWRRSGRNIALDLSRRSVWNVLAQDVFALALKCRRTRDDHRHRRRTTRRGYRNRELEPLRRTAELIYHVAVEIGHPKPG